MRVGDCIKVTRTFSKKDVNEFTDVSHDRNDWHVNEDKQGRLMAHGLLTTTMATVVGGMIGFMARQFTIEFLRPVYSGDTITILLTLTGLEEVATKALGGGKMHTLMTSDCEFVNQRGERVAYMTTRGVIPKPLTDVLSDPTPAEVVIGARL